MAFKSFADVSDDTELDLTPRDTASCTAGLCLRDGVGDAARPVGYALGPGTARIASSGSIDGYARASSFNVLIKLSHEIETFSASLLNRGPWVFVHSSSPCRHQHQHQHHPTSIPSLSSAVCELPRRARAA